MSDFLADFLLQKKTIWENIFFSKAQNIKKNKKWSKIIIHEILIRFFCLPSKEFSQKVRPYQKLLNQQLYEDLLNSYLESDREPTDNIPLPRNIKNYGIIDRNNTFIGITPPDNGTKWQIISSEIIKFLPDGKVIFIYLNIEFIYFNIYTQIN